MRKIYIVILSFLSIFVFNSHLNAQSVGTYVFAPSAGTYTPLAGTTTSTAAGDDGTQNVAIGFNFVFGGATYTNAVISTNGAIKLRADATNDFATSWTNNLSNAYGAAIIGPAWDDNNSTGGSVVYVTTGAVGSRTFSVEWINIHMGGIGSTTTPTATFQLTLFEGTNVIRFVYGTVNPLTASSIGIGLNDLVSFLSVTPGAPATASSATANNNITAATNLTSGTTYNFFPPPPCVAPPTGGTTQSSVGSACAGVPFNLSVTGASIGTGLTYLWQTSPNGLDPWASTGVTTAAYTVPSQTVATYYRRRITCSAVDGFSTALLVGQNTPSNCYCPVTFPLNVEPITLVNFNTINNATSATLNGTPPLENFTAITTNIFKGQSYPITVKGNTDGNFTTHINIYFDFNQDGDFDDLGENFYIGTIVNSTGLDAIQATGNILIPPTALDGNTRMRVMKKFNTQSPPCNNAGYGQAEDYTVNISTPLCLAPTGLTVSGITTNSATVSWTATTPAPAGGYQWEVRSSGAGGSGAAGLAANDSTAATTDIAGGLLANTVYNLYVRSNCGGASGFSAWSGPITFTTLCSATNVPYLQNFDAAVTPNYPSCLTVQDLNGATTWKMWYAGGVVAASLPNSIRYEWNATTAADDWFFVQGLNLTGGVTYSLTFKYKGSDGAFGYVEKLEVKYGTAPVAAAMTSGTIFTNTNIISSVNDPFAEPTSSFTPAVSGVYYIGFHAFSAIDQAFLYIDDIKVETCPAPTAVTATPFSSTSVSVNFTSPGSAFVVEYGPPGFIPGTTNVAGGGTVVIGGTSPIIVSGLTPSTAYDFYIRQICIPGVSFSGNVKVTATTLCVAANVTYTQDFETAVLPAIPTCTSIQTLSGNPWTVVNNPGSGFTNRTLRYAFSVPQAANSWFYTQGLNLTGGVSYRLLFRYGNNSTFYSERLKVAYGTGAIASSMTTTLIDHPNIIGGTPKTDTIDFVPAVTGVYYIGFQAYSLADQFYLFVDDITVKLSPKVDVGITGLIIPPFTCPTSGIIIQANLRNFNTTVQNFATYPVTVTANITGPLSGTLNTVINTGTLAPGATMGIYIPAFNFTTAGTYNITVATSSPDDPETANNSYTTSIVVNPNPATPVITPASASICIGNPVLLSTQFAPSPPPVSLPVYSGIISVNIPDNTPAGTSHTIAVTGIPAGANVTGVSVTINKIAHTYDGDLIINLKAPNNNVLNLMNQKGLGGDSLINTVISSTGVAAIPATGAPYTGTYAPDANPANPPTAFPQNVTTFGGLYSQGNGNWTLAVRDNAGLDVGILREWTITITYQVLTPVITWTPAAGLYTNAGATTAYTGGSNAYSVYANPAATSTYTVTATTVAGCTASASATVTVNPYPVITIGSIRDTVCISDPLVPLVASPVGGTWSGTGVSGSNFVPPATAVGTYTLTYSYTNAAGCPATATKRIVVKDCPERIILLRDNALTLYPNPNNGQFYIRMNSVLYNNLTMRVYANSGTLVSTQQFGGLAWGRVVPIDLTNLPGGLYMVKFSYEGGVRTSEKTFKVIIGTE